MSNNRPALPAQVRLPDGLQFAGTVDLAAPDTLCFRGNQHFSPVPPEGLPIHVMVTNSSGASAGPVRIAGSIARVDTQAMHVESDASLPSDLVDVLAPDGVDHLHDADTQPASDDRPLGSASESGPRPDLVETLHSTGISRLRKALQRFLVDLGDHLFDLSTSRRGGSSDKHHHYDALNALKRNGNEFIQNVCASVLQDLEQTVKGSDEPGFANLEEASPRSLDLVALDEMNRKLTVDKIVNGLVEKHRVELECLTIRAALIHGIDPMEARTPFQPRYIVSAFTGAFEQVTDSAAVVQDSLEFLGIHFAPDLHDIYTALNGLLADAGVEPDLEEEVQASGSLLNPVQKRVVKSGVRSGDDAEGLEEEAHEVEPEPDPAPALEAGADQPAGQNRGRRAYDRQPPAPGQTPGGTAGMSRDRHDAMYDAVLNALETNRGPVAPPANRNTDTPHAETPPGLGGDMADAAAGATAGPQAADSSAYAGLPPLEPQQLLQALSEMQAAQPNTNSLADLPPLENLISEREGGRVEREEANRLSFVDNVFRTLNNNFEVSSDMAPSLAQLRVPLAKLSLQEPKFFAQPDHPAHKLLDKLSVLASADHTVSRTLQNKVSAIVDKISADYDDDSTVFEQAQAQLDSLLEQQDKVFDRNIARVVSGLEGQEKLFHAQRRVESMLREHIDSEEAPAPVVDLLEGGWRSALVQLALREGENSVAWREESALLETLVDKLRQTEDGELDPRELKETQMRLRALNQRLNASNPGAVEHEGALRRLNKVLSGQVPLSNTHYTPSVRPRTPTDGGRIEHLPRLRRWVKRVKELKPGAKLRYKGKDGRRKHMRLVWTSEDGERYAFVNERGQKIAELSAVQLARQLGRGAQPPTTVDNMSVLDQSMYETLEQAQKTLSFDRNRDNLTQLINGESLLHQLQRTLRHAHARGSEHAFMLLDIDNFGLVNQVFDETTGDQVLSEFARLLSQLNDRRSLTARMQEDEFGILLTFQSADDAKLVGDKIRKDIADSTLSISGEVVSFTVSIGIAGVIQSSESPEIVVKQARAALALAKAQGRDQVVVYDVDQQDLLDFKRERETTRRRLDEAMSTDSLVLRAQPIVKSAVDGSESSKRHYEVLLALRGDDGELQSPHDFIMSAERFGYITLVDRWVVRETFAWISSLTDSQKEVPEMSINLSGTSITDNDFLDYVLEQISEYGVGTSRLCFEITETGAIDNLPRAADFVRTLKNLGCKFSLDDFGTGLASHKYLKELPVDYVKIDGTFITDIHQSRTDFAMAKSINDLAHFLGQKTVAECVETLEIIPSLREIGIDYLQGWGIGMPRELSDITEELASIET